jgi:hypothetical protein
MFTNASANIVTFVSDLASYDNSIVLDFQIPGTRQESAISGATFSANGVYVFDAFCVEMEQEPWSSNLYKRSVLSSTDIRYSSFSKLYNNWYSATKTSGIVTAAFAMAIYEIQYDSASASLNFSSGNFKLNGGPQNVVALANQMLAFGNAPNAATPLGWEFTIWNNPVDQDLIEGRRISVPAPSGMLLGLVGLLGMAGISRHRSVLGRIAGVIIGRLENVVEVQHLENVCWRGGCLWSVCFFVRRTWALNLDKIFKDVYETQKSGFSSSWLWNTIFTRYKINS